MLARKKIKGILKSFNKQKAFVKVTLAQTFQTVSFILLAEK